MEGAPLGGSIQKERSCLRLRATGYGLRAQGSGLRAERLWARALGGLRGPRRGEPVRVAAVCPVRGYLLLPAPAEEVTLPAGAWAAGAGPEMAVPWVGMLWVELFQLVLLSWG